MIKIRALYPLWKIVIEDKILKKQAEMKPFLIEMAISLKQGELKLS
jgi:hypothetical protein